MRKSPATKWSADKKVHDQIKASVMPKLPLIWSEFNASYMAELDVTDTTYMGPWMAPGFVAQKN